MLCNTRNLGKLPGETLETTLIELALMNERFYLTGSRFFGTATVHSDYDFFTQDSDMVRYRLRTLGFAVLPISESEYKDVNTVLVMRKMFPGSDIWIDVQLQKDAILKNFVQNQLYEILHYDNASKARRTEIWNMLYAAAGL